MTDAETELDHSPQSHYDRVTAAWGHLLGDDLHYGVFAQGDEPLSVATQALTDLMIEHAQLAPGLRMLDVGCGTGGPACAVADVSPVSILGISTSDVGVAEANARAAARGVADRISFEVRDGMDNRLPDASFDRAWALESSHLMPDRAALLRECARVLKPGGRFVLCDIMRMREIPFREIRSKVREFAVLRAAHGDARMEPLATYAALAEEAGFRVESQIDLTSATLPTFERWRANAVAHHDEVVATLGQQGLDEFVESTEILERFWKDDTLGYGLLAAVKQ